MVLEGFAVRLCLVVVVSVACVIWICFVVTVSSSSLNSPLGDLPLLAFFSSSLSLKDIKNEANNKTRDYFKMESSVSWRISNTVALKFHTLTIWQGSTECYLSYLNNDVLGGGSRNPTNSPGKSETLLQKKYLHKCVQIKNVWNNSSAYLLQI